MTVAEDTEDRGIRTARTQISSARLAQITVLLLFFGWLIDYVDRLIITLALPMIGHEYSLNKAEQGLIVTVFFITYAASQLPGGLLADRIGSRRTLTLALGSWSLFTVLTGLVTNYGLLLAVRAAFGVSEGLFPAASMKAVGERTSPRQRMTANALMFCSNSFGAAIAPLIAAPALALIGWHRSFFVVAALGFAMTFVMWRFLPAPMTSAATATEAEAITPRAQWGQQARRVLSSYPVWLCTVMYFGLGIVVWGLVAWTPSYFIEERHLSLVNSGALTSIPFLVGTATTVLGGFLFDRVFHRQMRLLVVPAMAATGIFIWCMIQSTSITQFVMWESLGTGTLFLAFMPILGMPLRMLPAEVAGAGAGLMNFGGQFGGAVSPFIMGLLADHFSFFAAFAFLMFGAGLSVIAALLCPQTTEAFARSLRLDAVSVP